MTNEEIERLKDASQYTVNVGGDEIGVDPREILGLVQKLQEAAARIEQLEAKNERLREALTPSGDTKAAYMGEFKFSDVVAHDNEGCPIYGHTYVPWTTIKEIMAAIRARAALAGKEPT